MKYLARIFSPIYLTAALAILASCQKIIPSLSSDPTLFSGGSAAPTANPTAWEYKTFAVQYSPLQVPDLLKKNGQPVCSLDLTNPNSPQNSSFPCFVENGDAQLLAHLNQFGQEGWELVSVSSYDSIVFIFFFKRPLPIQ